MSRAKGVEALIKNGLLIRGDDERLELQRLPSGIPSLDDLLGGGWPIGDYTMIVGRESTGKTILTQYAAASNQQNNSDRPQVLYVDTEHSYDRGWWERSGVDVNKLWVMRAASGESLIDSMVQMIDETPDLGMIILDSIAGMHPSIMMDESAERSGVADHARLMTKFYNRINALIFKHGIAVVKTNQTRTRIGMPGETYPGGNSVSFFSHVILRTKRTGWITEDKNRIGFEMEVECTKNKTSQPQRTIKLPFMFSSQIDLVATIMNESIEAGLIVAKGPYYEIDGEKFLGKQNLREHLQATSGLIDQLRDGIYGR